MKSSATILALIAGAILATHGAPAAAPSLNPQVLQPTPVLLPEQRLAAPLTAFEIIAQLKKTLADIDVALTKANFSLEALIPGSPVLQQIQAIISQLESDSNSVILKAIGQIGNAGSLEELVHIAQLAALEIKELAYAAFAEIQDVLFNGGGGDLGELLGKIQDIYFELALDLHEAIQPLLDLIGEIPVFGGQGSKGKVTPEDLLRQLAETLRQTREAVTDANEKLQAVVGSSPVGQDIEAIVAKLDAESNAVMERALEQLGNVGSLEEIVHIMQLAGLEVKELAYVAFGDIKEVIQTGGPEVGELIGQVQDVAWELTVKVREAVKPLLDLIEQIQKPRRW